VAAAATAPGDILRGYVVAVVYRALRRVSWDGEDTQLLQDRRDVGNVYSVCSEILERAAHTFFASCAGSDSCIQLRISARVFVPFQSSGSTRCNQGIPSISRIW